MLSYAKGVLAKDLSASFTSKLELAWRFSGVPYVITSGYRKGDGAHGTRKAADLRCGDSRSRFLIIYGLLKAGFQRVGIGSVNSPHIHVDMAVGLMFEQNVFWLE